MWFCAASSVLAVPAWRLVWADEFDRPDGSPPLSSRWGYETGNKLGWGNGELQTYTTRPENVRIEGGHLVIEARKEVYTGSDGTFDYTSARIKTQDRYSRAYGRFEARMRLPAGQGLWPALWLLGANFTSVGWPACGEIDIMEHIGREPSTVHGAAHGPGYSGVDNLTGLYTLPNPARFSGDFHVFAVEWVTNRIRWLVDERLYFSITPATVPAGSQWVFNHSFFIILNLAVGGYWPGAPDATTAFPARLLVDYVRVYAPIDAPTPQLEILQSTNQVEAVWSADFPHAILQRASWLSLPWTNYASSRLLLGSEIHAPISPAFYRLRVNP